ncbi:helix-turn-helix domain-containing protein [Burkholderia cepacia]|uniref:helix-turn-helix domain-containing protein n=1 Tax=Burkholderia TaxID=32008 RepID=UPI00075ABB20|nr:helix-turn-helix transcriptional regulator [Burkholderia cepacia]KVW76960.1 XRE family transcriptional regulator [Burkholderia cepacia]KVX66440.1 XRE family transcriptional regulator [Burkholderia cepacia]
MAKARPAHTSEERYAPVRHSAEDTARLLTDPAIKAEYDALEEEFTALRALLDARKDAGLTQAQVAERMGTTTSAVSRLEASFSSEKHSPSFATLRKYAAACGKKLVISFA